MDKEIFVTLMYRYGDFTKHHYLLGVFTSGRWAIISGIIEKGWRNEKYMPEVLRFRDRSDPEVYDIVYTEVKDAK